MRVTLGVLASLFLATTAVAGTLPADLCKDGHKSVVRTRKLKSPDSRALFDKAVQDHVAWYRSHGFSQNRILVGPVLVRDDITNNWSESPDEFVSIHLDYPPQSAVKPDAAWEAYVAEYRASSDIATEQVVCLHEPGK
jgi:hypothetical protein